MSSGCRLLALLVGEDVGVGDARVDQRDADAGADGLLADRPGHPGHRPLRHGVQAGVADVAAGDRAGDEQVPRRLLQRGQDRAGGVGGAEHVGADHRLPRPRVGVVVAEERRPDADPGVGEGGVEPPEPRHGLGDGGGDGGPVPDVGAEGEGPILAELGGEGGDGLGPAGDEGDLEPGSGGEPCGRGTEPARRTGDEENAIIHAVQARAARRRADGRLGGDAGGIGGATLLRCR